jgi:hypothetical protein
MTDHANTYPDLVNVEDWLNAKGYTGEAGACHQAMSLIRNQEKHIEDLRKEADMMHSEYKTARARIAELKAALNGLMVYGCPACNGDCSAANPPVIGCPMEAARAAYRGEKE